MSKSISRVLGASVVAAGVLLASREVRAQEQPFDHMTCVKISRDDRLARMPPPLALTSQQSEFLTSSGCKPVGGGRIARADEVCYPSAKAPSNPPGGIDLSGQNFLCYRVRCERNGGGNRTELSITDQFGEGTVFANERPVTKKLCVPAYLAGAPTPTPGASPTPTVQPTGTPVPTETPEPTETPGPTGTPAPTETPEPTATAAPTETPEPTGTPEPTETPAPTETPEPTPTVGSASLAFVAPVTDLLR